MEGFLQQQLMLFMVLLSLFVCFLTLVNTRFGLSILIFAMLLSPELEVFKVPIKAVVVRVEDFLIGTVFITWLAKMAVVKELYLFRGTPLNLPILFYIALCILSTLIGMITGSVQGFSSLFFIVKYIEYFLLFFMFVNNVNSKRDIQRFLAYFLLTGLIVCLFSLSQYGKVPRLSAPFEGKNPEPASLGGYLLVVISCALGLLSYPEWPRLRWPIWLFFGLFVVTLVLSTSRGALVAFVPLYLTALLLASRRRKYLVLVAIVGLLFGTPLVPKKVTTFLQEGFKGKTYQYGEYRVEVGPTGEARIEHWKYLMGKLKRRPILGLGVTGAGMVDNQHMRVLAETGILGLFIFVWLLRRILQVGFFAFRNGPDNFSKALGMILVCATVALIFQGLTANSFIIVRIMEPFWFLTAVTYSISQLKEEASSLNVA